VLVDRHAKKLREVNRFLITLGILTPVVFGFEILLTRIGLRGYAPEIHQTVSGIYLAGVPLEALYYVPVFLALVISFSKYCFLIFDGQPMLPLAQIPWLRTLTLALTGVLLFELMVEPLVLNTKFPAWSYLYKDITLLMTGLWIVVIWLAVNLSDRMLIHWQAGHRFLASGGITAAIALPLEGWFIENGYRVYGPSAVANFSGLTLPGTSIPLEVAFAIPLYLSLVISFIQYMNLVIASRL
jgi:hypothetical protein